MDYEKAYKEALERARSGMRIDEVFPELRESGDEKMMDDIMEAVETWLPYERVEEIRAYLGRQKEQKEQTKDEQEYVRTLKSLISDFLRDKQEVDTAYYQKIYDWLDERHIEQKPAEWSEEYREEDLRTRFAFYTYKDEDGVLYLSNVFVEETSRNKGFGTKILAAAEKVAETLGAISICLKVKQNSPANAWYRKHGYGYIAFEGDYDWLEKTLEYLKPNKQEWSKEDKNIHYYLCKLLRETWDKVDKGSCIDDAITWFEELPERIFSHSWKPSEEQMEWLESAVRLSTNKPHIHGIIISLYEQLKRL